MEVEDLLEKLKETNDELSMEVFQDYAREFRRTKTNIQHALEQANLLSGVRNDIDAYKSSTADSLLAERSRIDSSHRMTDEIIELAYETRADFSRQSASLAGIRTRMTNVINTMPGINNLLSMIKSRRRRDSIIVGVVVGVCLLLLLSYLTR